MAGFEAIAGVSSTLRTLLLNRMEDPVTITIAPPDVTLTDMDGIRANLYLYQVNENGSLKNQEIPGTGHPAAYGSPPLSLDLGYLITTHGATPEGVDADLQAQQVLGDVMRVFHDHAIVDQSLLDPSLVGEFERIKIVLVPNHLDELSKIWAAMPETAFRRSVIYQVSVVQIESRRPRRSALPVRRRGIYVLPLATPVLEEMFREPPFEPLSRARSAVVEVGNTLVIVGRNLAGLATRVRIGTTDVAVAAPQERRLEITVPTTLTAGTHTVQVLQDLPLQAEIGQPPVLHRGFQSNILPLLVIPSFSGVAPGSAAAGETVTVTVDPPVEARQSRSLLLGDREIPGLAVAPASPPSATFDVELPTGSAAVPPGTHLLRVRVDGAESRLTFDATTGAYDGPTFTVTP